MASWTKKLSGDNRYKVELTVTEEEPTSADIASNSSRVTYSLDLTKSSGSGYYTSNKNNPIKVVINGETVVNKNISYDFRNHSSINVASGTKPIQHEPDGTKTIACSGYFKDNENSLGNATASGNLKLTDLHKPPEPSINSIIETNSVLTGYGITGSQFVAYLSKKQFGISSIKYDNVSIINYTIKNGTNTLTTSGEPSTITLDFKNKALALENNKVKIELTAVDSMYSIGSTSVEYENPILYFPVTIVASSFKSQTKRAGQLTGNITLSANGTYFNGSVGNQTITPKVYYRYKEKTASTFTSWTQIANASINKNNGNWSTSITLSGFNYQKAYDIEVKVSDNVAEANGLNVATASTTIPVGEPTWTEYKDRVDFKKLTIQGNDIENALYYKKGDTYEADYIYTGGFLSNSTKGVYFTIFLPKSFKPNGTGDYAITTCTINQCTFEIRKSNGGYLENGTGVSTFSTIEFRPFTDNRLSFICTKASAYSSATNNTPIGVGLENLKVTFN